MPSRYSIIPSAAVRDVRLTDPDIRVLASLGSFTDDDGRCWPSIGRIRERALCSERTVQRALKRLTDLGYVLRDPRRGHSNIYVVKLDTPSSGTPTPVQPDTPSSGTPTPVQPDTQNVPKDVPNESGEANIFLPATRSAGAAGSPRFMAVAEILPEVLRRIPPRETP